MALKEDIQKFFKGEVEDSEEALEHASRDASLFRVRPKLVVFPKDSEDLGSLVKYINAHKAEDPTLSLSVRAAGSCMSGGSLNESIVADVSRHMNTMGEIADNSVWVEPGMFYRDFEVETLKQGLILPCYTASKNLCALGGMLGNNCAGEKTLRYGKMENFVLETRVIFADGEEYTVKPLDRDALERKMRQADFEGNLYKQVFNLVDNRMRTLEDARPKVSKNSAGYYLWNVWDGRTFDLNKLLVGSQGTLGVVTRAKLRLMPVKRHHDLIAIFFKSWNELPAVVNAILPHDPEGLETFDKETLKLGLRFMPEIARKAGSNLLSFAAKFLPEAVIGARMLGLPELIILVEVAEDTEEEVKRKVSEIMEGIKPFPVWSRVVEKDSEEEKFWIMRRESFNLLRQHVKGKRTAPFIDDFCILPDRVPEFLPKALKILKANGIDVNIAGHAGNGNFHIIPLMDFKKAGERAKIAKVSDEFYNLVNKFEGTITAEHNDGIVRTPYLGKMYSKEILDLFKDTKNIFDPTNIFNPGKKVPTATQGTVSYMENHIDSAT